MRPIVVFGTGQIAELAHFYFSQDGHREVAAFTVDRQYMDRPDFCGLPVVAFEQVVERFPPARYDMFIALSYSRLNGVRRERFEAAQAMGYRLASYVSPRATIAAGTTLGENCFILEDNTVQPFVRIGTNVTLWSGNHIGHHASIGDHCFVASHVVISGGVSIGESCFIGVNATIRDHVRIGARCVIGAGALILADADDEGVYVGRATERSRVPSGRLRKI